MKKILLFLFSLLILTSCDKKEIEHPIESIGYIYHARQCKYAWAFNVGLNPVPYYDTFVYEEIFLHNDEKVNVNQYELAFTTLNISLDDIKESDLGDNGDSTYLNDYRKRVSSGESNMLYGPPFVTVARFENTYEEAHDIAIEKKLNEYFRKKSKTRTCFVALDYRTTPIKNLNITASQDIDGIKAGKSLNSLFVVSGYESRHYFISIRNKVFVCGNYKIMMFCISINNKQTIEGLSCLYSINIL